MNKSSRFKGWFIYLLAVYVIIQFAWWAYMLVHLNYELYLVHLEAIALSELPSPELQILKHQLDNDLYRRIWMVLGEGAVFMFLLILGIRKVRSAIAREIELARTQNNFLLSITHELKSPLAALKLQLQTLRQRQLEPAKQQQILERSQKESERLELLVEDLLLTARMDSGKGKLNIEKVNVSDIICRLVKDHYSEQISSSRIAMNIDADCEALCDKQALVSIGTNLIDNAIKYSGPDGLIEVGIELKSNSLVFRVMDNGPGIPENERSKIFDRFYRAGNEETRNAKGTGLGLYIVARLVEEMNGDLKLNSGRPSGCHFIITLPCHNA
ncbi:MAG: signal transduction histidine kinase [Granulosicoccus sp.]|jgi:signal transduction histidine kinase